MQNIWIVQQLMIQMIRLLFSPLSWISAAVIYWQTRWQIKRKQKLFQVGSESVISSVGRTLLAGWFGGCFASIVLLLFGVSLEQIGLRYLWLLSICLSLIRKRFFCFAYSGSILALFNWMTDWISMENTSLFVLIAVLHCTEGFLVWTTGHYDAMPMYVESKTAQPTGGFLLKKIWPLPLAILFGEPKMITPPENGFFFMPHWWPILHPLTKGIMTPVLYVLFPVLGALGYCGFSWEGNLRKKTRQTAILLFLYGSVLLCFSLLAQYVPACALLPIIFSLVGHEGMLQYDKWCETKKNGYLTAPKIGVGILDVQKGSPAEKAGLRRKDCILALDGIPIQNRISFLKQQHELPMQVQVRYLRNGKEYDRVIWRKQPIPLGILPMPDAQCHVEYMIQEDRGLLKEFWEKWKRYVHSEKTKNKKTRYG